MREEICATEKKSEKRTEFLGLLAELLGLQENGICFGCLRAGLVGRARHVSQGKVRFSSNVMKLIRVDIVALSNAWQKWIRGY